MTEAANFIQSGWNTSLGIFTYRKAWYDRRYYFVTFEHSVLWVHPTTYLAVVDDFGNLVEVRL